MKPSFFGLSLACLIGTVTVSYSAPNVQNLVESLREDDEVAAQAAQEELVKLGPDAVRPLQKVLDDANFKVRRRAAEVLGRLGPVAKKAAPELVDLLGDPQVEVHEAVEKALIAMGEDAIPALSATLKSDKEGLRKRAMVTLSRCGPKAIPIFLQILKKDENTFIRASAAEELGNMKAGDTESVQGLVQALSDLEEVVRGVAADSLGQLGAAAHIAIRPLFNVSQQDKEALVRKKAMDALIQIGHSSKELETEVINAFNPLLTSQDSYKKAEALQVLESFAPKVEPKEEPKPRRSKKIK